MNTALRMQSPELADKLEGRSEAELRHIAYAVAGQAIARNDVTDPLVTTALDLLRQQVSGSTELIADLSRLADTTEDAYLTALDAGVDIMADEALMSQFRKARAITALYLALDENITQASGNAVYEALYSGLKPADILPLL